jgi:hypothetical protein
MIFLILPSITNITFEAYKCTTMYDGKKYLDMDVSIPCWEGQHLAFALVVGLIIIFVWVIGLPVFAYLKLTRLNKERDTEESLSTWGFFYKGLKKETYYWEMFRHVVKVILIVVNTFVSPDDPLIKVRTQVD